MSNLAQVAPRLSIASFRRQGAYRSPSTFCSHSVLILAGDHHFGSLQSTAWILCYCRCEEYSSRGRLEVKQRGAFIVCAVAGCVLAHGCLMLAAVSEPTVKTSQGEAAGKWIESGTEMAFLVLPYATPPIGELRWKPPQGPVAWK